MTHWRGIRTFFGIASMAERSLVCSLSSRRAVGALSALILPTVLIWTGCGRNDLAGKLPVTASLVQTSGAAAGLLVVEHDFGRLKPGQAVKHNYEIMNNSSGTWTFRKIVNTCACTTSGVSAPQIKSGKTEKVGVTFTAGGVTSDENRKILVLFEEAAAPKVALVVKAQVREPLNCYPTELSFLELGKDQSRQDGFEVHNFSDSTWDTICVVPSAEWLRVSTEQISLTPGTDSPRQIWRITATADATGLAIGEHKARITVEAGVGGVDFLKDVPTLARVTSPVRAIPAQFFFGRIHVGEIATQSIKIRFSPDAIPKRESDVTFSHNFGNQLRLAWTNKSHDGEWELLATLTPSDDESPRSKLTVSFGGEKSTDLEIPIYAALQDSN